MRLEGFGLGVFGAIAIVAVVLALASIWLFVTNPVTVANAVTEGTVSPLVRELAAVLLAALQGLLKYL
jgi:hypothetical protein